MQRAIPVHYASGLLLVHRRFEKSSALQLAQLFFDRLYIHHLSIAGFNTVGDLDHFSNTLPKNDLKVNKVDSVFWLQKSSILSSPFPSLRGDCVASPFMVRQAHHERTINIKYQLVRPSIHSGRTADYDTVSRGRACLPVDRGGVRGKFQILFAGVFNFFISDRGDRDPRNSLPRKRFDLMPNSAAKCNLLLGILLLHKA